MAGIETIREAHSSCYKPLGTWMLQDDRTAFFAAREVQSEAKRLRKQKGTK